jgi:hypothetical protein
VAPSTTTAATQSYREAAIATITINRITAPRITATTTSTG